MVLFNLAAVFHLCIRIFLVIKLGRKEFLSKKSIIALSFVAIFSALILLYIRMVSHIKHQFHPAIALLFNFLNASLLGYLFLSNKDAVELVNTRMKRCLRNFSFYNKQEAEKCNEQDGHDKDENIIKGNVKDGEEMFAGRVQRIMVKEVVNRSVKMDNMVDLDQKNDMAADKIELCEEEKIIVSETPLRNIRLPEENLSDLVIENNSIE